jgi:hypothetical protein
MNFDGIALYEPIRMEAKNYLSVCVLNLEELGLVEGS